MPVTISVATIWLGVILLALLVTTAGLTVGWSILAARRDRKRSAVYERLKADLLATISDDESQPDWDNLVLSESERMVLMELLHTRLRVLKGDARDRLADIALTRKLDEQALHRIRTGAPPHQRTALHFLSVLGADIDPNDILEPCRWPTTSRVAATEALLNQSDTDPMRLVRYLLEPGEPLSQRGMDVLLDLCIADSRQILGYFRENYPDWELPLLIQVLTVISKGFPQTLDEPLAWVIDIAVPKSGFVFQDVVELRTAAIAALRPYGWRTDIREELSIHRLLTDANPRIRRATYELLGAWSDDTALDMLEAALPGERDDRARLRGAKVLYRHRPHLHPTAEPLERTWEWVQRNAAAMEGT